MTFARRATATAGRCPAQAGTLQLSAIPMGRDGETVIDRLTRLVNGRLESIRFTKLSGTAVSRFKRMRISSRSDVCTRLPSSSTTYQRAQCY